MLSTIESTHCKIVDKINIVKNSIREIQDVAAIYHNDRNKDKKHAEMSATVDNLYIGLTSNMLEDIESNYNLAVTVAISEYYANPRMEEQHTKEYYRIITSENFAARVDDIISRCRTFIDTLQKIARAYDDHMRTHTTLSGIWKNLDYAKNIEIKLKLERNNYEICKCGTRMMVIPEYSELRCGNCQRIKTILGVVFRDDQFYPQEGQKTKHGGYDTGRHYRFWIERIQALENKVFPEEDEFKIEYVIKRYNIDRSLLNIMVMRNILKEIKLTKYNDHAALLVVLHGGPPPPKLNYQQNRTMSIQFHKAMVLYDIIVPDGGNKPYYPYFIYKIIQEMFKNDPEMLHLLDYIHLQSRDTVVKNDNIFEKICETPMKDGLAYSPTDPAGRL